MALTSRNFPLFARRALARRNPDLITANGGGCNAILVRGMPIGEHRIRELTKRPERRVMHGITLPGIGWVVNLHASTHPPEQRRADLMGAAATPLAFGEIYTALEKGTIDAAEWVGPYDDQKLGFVKVAPNYYYPGFWEGSAQLDFFINNKAWDALSPENKAIVEAAASQAHIDIQAKYDARNPAALRRLLGAGTQLRPFSQEILEAAYKAAGEVYDETSAKNPDFKKVHDSIRGFRNEEYLWFQVAEYAYDTFMIRARARG